MAKDAFEDDDDVLVCSDSDIDDELDWLDSKKDDEYIKGSFSSSLRPNAHGGHHSYSSVLKPLSNRHHKFTSQIRASPLEWEGGLNIAMSNTVTTAIRSSVRGMAIGKARTNDKADRATVENAIDPRTRMILYKLLSRGELENIHGCISTGKEANHLRIELDMWMEIAGIFLG
ncbi:non-specific serine/threonine protein kinase [Trifolium repens]|nr:non-specific serine/threonine protein kinase [Trifolium repens]